MPQDRLQDHPRAESQRSESARSERSRSERAETTNTTYALFGEMGPQSVKTGLRLQKQMFDVLQDIGREWSARATSEAELALKLPNKLTAAQTVPDALSAYQEWLGEWMNMCGEDSRRFIADSRKIMDTGVRCLTDTSPAMTS